MTVPIRPVTERVLAAIAAAVAPTKVGDGQAPPGSTVTSPAWLEVFALGPQLRDGAWQDPGSDPQVIYQVRAVGKGRQQVEWLLDKVSEVMLGRGPTGDYAVSFDAPSADGFPAVRVWMRAEETTSGYDPAIDLQLPQRADQFRLWLCEG